MIRLTLLLLVGLFFTLQIAGRDGGAQRFGLVEGERDVAAAAARPEAPAPRAKPVEVAFTPVPRVVTPVPPATLTAAPTANLLYVSGNTVNVRSGPSTDDTVIDRLARGDAVTLVQVEDNGWARIRIEGDGIDGYISMDFLTDTAP